MAVHECEAYWQEFLRRPQQQREALEEQKKLRQEMATRMAKRRDVKTADLREALTGCTEQQQLQLSPLLESPGIADHLHDVFLLADRQPGDFSRRLDSNRALQVLLQDKAQQHSQSPNSLEKLKKCFEDLQHEATRPLSAKDFAFSQQRSWKSLPPAELAERLSKGEICPREEWVPGISKGKRPLARQALAEHMAFGQKLAREGREAYAAADFETSFLRFRQGVELFNWVQAEDETEQTALNDLYSTFLRNVALAALKLQKYQEAIRACNCLLEELDENDSKGRYRRGRAYMLLGCAKRAKEDFLFILQSPYSTAEGVSSARAGLQELRRIVLGSREYSKAALGESLRGSLFSTNRPLRSRPGQFEAAGCEETAPPEKETGGVAALYPHGQSREAGGNNVPGDTRADGLRGDSPRDTAREEEETARAGTQGDTQHGAETDPLSEDTRGDTQRDLPLEAESAGDSLPSPPPPPLDLTKTQSLLLSLLWAYTSEPVASQLNELRSLADFDFRRVVIRARRFLPAVQTPVFEKHGLNRPSHRSNMRALELSVAYWRSRDTETATLARDCLDAIFGEVADIDAS